MCSCNELADWRRIGLIFVFHTLEYGKMQISYIWLYVNDYMQICCSSCSIIMSNQELVDYVTEENKRRKRKRLVLTKMYFEVSMLALAYVSTQRAPRDLGAFTEFEEKVAYRKYVLKKTYNGSETRCYDELRLTKRNFHNLCAMLREKCGLKDTKFVTVEENVAMFLQVVGHGTKMRMIRFERSLETTSRHFKNVLDAILSLTGEFIKLPEPAATPPDDYKSKWFPDALGALDGCHIPVFVNAADKGRYRNRKQDITTNMLGVVDWNMKFLYVLPGWEGSASDSRVLKDAMRIDRQDAFVVPQGTTLSLGFLFLICNS